MSSPKCCECHRIKGAVRHPYKEKDWLCAHCMADLMNNARFDPRAFDCEPPNENFNIGLKFDIHEILKHEKWPMIEVIEIAFKSDLSYAERLMAVEQYIRIET